ncbi:MAG: carbohydrate binding domain-containing protein, partial [Oscillospiraceae bacterium]
EINFVLKLDSDWYTKNGNVVSSAPAINNEYFAIPASTHTNESARPILVVSYVNTTGITGHMTYHSQSLGAVNSSINDATGELTLIQNLFTDSGSRLPVSINLVYNGSNYNKFNNGGLKLAKGYTSNLNTKIVNPSSVSTTNTSKPVVMVDGDGTLLYFINKKDDDKFYNELDDKQYLEKLPTPTGGVIIKYYNETDKSELIFNNNGYLINIKDNSGNTVSLNYDSSNKLISLETADGKTINFGYVTIGGSYYLAIIKDYLNKEVILNYELAQNSVDTVLKSVVYPDSSKIEYVYGQQYNRELGTADGYIAKTVLGKSTTGSITGKLAFDFNYKSDVTHVTYYGANNAKGQEMGIIYSGNRKTEFTTSGSDDAYGTSDDLKTTYCFDNAGRTVSVYNNFDFSSSYEYSNKEDNSKNKITNTTASKKPSVNLLKNNSFENSNNWTNIASAGQSLVSTPVYSGSYSLKLLSTTTSDNEIGRKQTVTLKPSTTYTFSAYVKAENDLALATNGGAYLRVESTDSPVKSDLINCQTSPNYTFSSALDNPKESWRRLSVTFKTNSNASQPATLYVASNYMSGTVYFDAAQLEESDGATSYNLVENGGFDNDWLSWYNKDLGNGDNIINENGNKYFRFKGNLPYETKLKQTIPCNLNRDSVLMFTAKVRGNALPSKINRDLSIKIGINYSNKYSTSKTVKINTEVKDIWQTINLPVSLYHELASEIVESMTIELNYSYQANYIEFDDISLTTDPSMTYNYDSNGNLISSIKNAEQKSSMQYDADDNLKKIVDAKGYDYEYEYNNDKTLKSSQTQTGVKYEFTYDA